jgi:tRNA (guanine37-N1)-methyltransferase
MKIEILTLFPEMFTGFLNESIIARAISKHLVSVKLINFRDYSKLSNNQVDDTPYGGGAGMVIRPETIFDCLDDIDPKHDAYVILMTPDGHKYQENMAKDLTKHNHIIIICGHYEGFDERIRTLVDAEISIGDFILTGGEIPAMAVIDSITRLVPGVINADSLASESFENNLLDYPTYTKPAEYRGMKVPEILLSGDHKKIAEWRLKEQIKKTKEKRPDLLK